MDILYLRMYSIYFFTIISNINHKSYTYNDFAKENPILPTKYIQKNLDPFTMPIKAIPFTYKPED